MVAASNTRTKLDPFTEKRIVRFIETFRESNAQLPTLKDFANEGFGEELVALAEKKKLIAKFYVTLTNGAIVKGYKVVRD